MIRMAILCRPPRPRCCGLPFGGGAPLPLSDDHFLSTIYLGATLLPFCPTTSCSLSPTNHEPLMLPQATWLYVFIVSVCPPRSDGRLLGYTQTPRQPGSPRWSGWPLASPSDGATLLLSTTGGDVPTLSASDPRRLSRPYRPRLRRHRLGAFSSMMTSPTRLSCSPNPMNHELLMSPQATCLYVCVVSVCPPRSTRLSGEVVARVQTPGVDPGCGDSDPCL